MFIYARAWKRRAEFFARASPPPLFFRPGKPWAGVSRKQQQQQQQQQQHLSVALLRN